jgi:P27 family predicted phage terminase small subunit
MRGRKPKPTHLKLIIGNPGNHPLNRAEPKPKGGAPKPPPELNADALAEWKRVSPRLLDAGILTSVDRATLAAYCQAFGRWREAERALADIAKRNPLTNLMIETKSGNFIQNPLLGIANKAMSDMVRYAAELGMTPSARSRVTKTSHDPQNDRAEDFFPA